jgi:hypothetical protein
MADQLLPEVYRKSGQELVNYDFSDVANGVGFILLYGSATTDSVGVDYVLNRSVTTSRPLYVYPRAGWSTPTAIDEDFDITVTKDMIIQGIATINIKFGQIGAGSGAAINEYVVCKLRKYSGTTETEVASVQTETGSFTGAGTIRTQLQMDVPKTHYKVGDILRLTVIVTVSSSLASLAPHIMCDPETSADTFKLFLPVRIDI